MENENVYEVVARFAMLRGWVSFKYRPLPECKRKVSPSVAAARRSTVVVGKDFEAVSGFLTDGTRNASCGEDGDDWSLAAAESGMTPYEYYQSVWIGHQQRVEAEILALDGRDPALVDALVDLLAKRN